MAKWRLEAIIPNNGFVCSIIKVLFKVTHLGLGLGAGCSWVQSYTFGAGAGGWVLLGSTGLVLSGPAQDPARLVYGSAALVASLREQQNHFATLPIMIAKCRGGFALHLSAGPSRPGPFRGTHEETLILA